MVGEREWEQQHLGQGLGTLSPVLHDNLRRERGLYSNSVHLHPGDKGAWWSGTVKEQAGELPPLHPHGPGAAAVCGGGLGSPELGGEDECSCPKGGALQMPIGGGVELEKKKGGGQREWL